MKIHFTDADLERVRLAVTEAERQTSGEIVPYVVPQSDTYDVAVWRGAAGAALLALAVAFIVMQLHDGWGMAWLYAGWGPTVLALVAGTLGAVLAAYVPALKRWLTGSDRLDQTVHRRAMQAFVEEEVFKTRDRTGILLFVSLLEHRIEVLGDEGINRYVQPDQWADVVLRIRQGIREGKPTEGLVEAIDLCGCLLDECGVQIQPDDTDELPNDLRFPGNE